MKNLYLKILPFFLFLSVAGIAQELMPIPPQTTTFTGLTRGYWFTAPRDFVITAVRVPTDASTAPQSIVVVKLNTPPPLFPMNTTDYETLALFQNVPGSDAIPVDIEVTEGDVIGILGSRGSNSVNSYGSPNPHNTTILGEPVVIDRFLMQGDLETQWPFQVSTELNGTFFGRVEMTVSADRQPLPSMGQWGLILLGILVVSFGAFYTLRSTPTVES